MNSLLIYCILVSNSFAQTHKIDSLRMKMNGTTNVATKKDIISKILEQQFSLPADSMLNYIRKGQLLFDPSSNDFIKLKNYYCSYLFKTGKVEEGMRLSDSLVQHIPADNDKLSLRLEILSTNCGGLIRNGQNKEAIEQCFKILQLAEPIKDTVNIIRAYTLMGWSNMELEQYTDAIKWLKKAIYFSTPNLLDKAGVIYANTASCYNNIQQSDSALHYVDLALYYARSSENLTTIANSLNIRADIYINKKKYTEAEKDMTEALAVREMIGEPLYIISDMAQLSSFYASTNQTDKGIAIAKNGIAIAEKTNNLSKLIFLYSALSENYKQANRLNDYCASLETLVKLKDSLYKNNSGKAIAEMEAKYELQKKENIIMRQEYEITRSRYTNIAIAFLSIIGLLFLWVLYRNYRLIQKRKLEAAMAEQKILSYKAVEQAEEKERKRIAADLHDNLGSYAAAISSNVKYLKEKETTSTDNILFQLDENAQNIVTQLGDTIWVLKNEHLLLTKLADRFKVWLQRLIKNYPEVKYYYSENIVNDIELTPTTILQVFLMLKECTNNALKHSHCSELKINFKCEAVCIITIEDNGIGFENPEAHASGGIYNIIRRAKECGWKVEWKKNIPSGTIVTFYGNTTN